MRQLKLKQPFCIYFRALERKISAKYNFCIASERNGQYISCVLFFHSISSCEKIWWLFFYALCYKTRTKIGILFLWRSSEQKFPFISPISFSLFPSVVFLFHCIKLKCNQNAIRLSTFPSLCSRLYYILWTFQSQSIAIFTFSRFNLTSHVELMLVMKNHFFQLLFPYGAQSVS